MVCHKATAKFFKTFFSLSSNETETRLDYASSEKNVFLAAH